MTLELPAFLDRKLNPTAPATLDERRAYCGSAKKLSEEEILVAGAWSDAEKEAIRERFALKREAAKAAKVEAKRLATNGRTIRLGSKLEGCPLAPGEHLVELVHLGRKRVKFRVPGRTNCVRTTRRIWDIIEQKGE